MKLSKYFSRRSKQNRVNQRSAGRIARMENLEERRVLSTTPFMLSPGDSQSTVNSVISDAISNPGPDTIVLKPGNYYREFNISGENSELKIIGLGNVYLNGVNFSGSDDEIVDIISNSGTVILKNLTVRDSRASDDNIYVYDTHTVKFYNVHSLSSDADGVDAQYVDYFYAYDSKFNDNKDNGIELGPGVDYAYLKDVQARNNWGNGVWYDNSENQQGLLDIYSGDFSKNHKDGIYANDVEEVYIDTIYANDNYYDGLYVENGDVEVVDINYAAFDGNGDDGMDLQANTEDGYIEVTTTRALHNDEDGLDIGKAYEVYVYNSEYSYNGENGLEINNTYKAKVDYIAANYNGAEESDDTGDGLEATYVHDLLVHNSEFLKNEDDGVDVDMKHDAKTKLDYVEASYNYDNGVQLKGYGSAHIITVGMRGNDGNGLRAEGLKYLHIHNSTATHNGYNGVKVLGAGKRTDVYAHYNNFSHNYYDGFHAQYAGDVLIKQLKAEYNYDNGVHSDYANDIAIEESPFIRYNLGGDFGGTDFI